MHFTLNRTQIKNAALNLALILLFVLEARWVQVLPEGDLIKNLLILDLAWVGLLILLPAVFLYFAATVQFFLSFLIYSYASALESKPSLSALVNGFDVFTALGGHAFDYLNPLAGGILLLCLIAKIVLIRRRTPPPKRAKGAIALLCILVLGINAYTGIRHQRFGRFLELQDLDNEMGKHLKDYGYLLTWTIELASGQPFETKDIFQERTCRDDRIAKLPLFPLGGKIIIIQTESLDFSAIGLKQDGQTVTPFLTGLAQKSLLLRMDGRKLLGSCNSDYELLNGKIASSKALYYMHIPSYPDSIIKILREKGYEASVIHGLKGEYMGLRSIYPKLGFNHLFFREELAQAGYKIREDTTMKQIPDADLFKFALQQTKANAPFVHFIITITMHGGNPPLSARFTEPGYINDVAYYDDALASYIRNLPQGCTVFIYGDHQSYDGPQKTRTVPFLVYQNDKDLSALQAQIPAKTVFTRCEISHYLKQLFLSAQP